MKLSPPGNEIVTSLMTRVPLVVFCLRFADAGLVVPGRRAPVRRRHEQAGALLSE
jgi:hypothetical protein